MMQVPGAWQLRAKLLGAACALFVSAAVYAGSIGETIYRQGVLPSGQLLQAEREPGMHIEGATAACINCHRRSGLGMTEGRRTIPPIAGSYLFHPRAANADELDLPFVEGMKADRDPYDEQTLARAIRTGIGADGQPLSYLMPHFQLNDAEMAALIAYLKQLSPAAVPGVTESVLHFATIVTPDADPMQRTGVLQVLTRFFDDKNRYTRAESPRLHSSRRMMFKVNRRWELHVWQLTGAPDTWEAQLRAKLAAEPVFAVISGVGGRTWAPVEHFCETEELPCLFPNVDLPVDREGDFDSLYLSKGVLLEAQLIAHELRAHHGSTTVGRVVQIFRSQDVGKDAAAALSAALRDDGIPVIEKRLGAGTSRHELNALLAESAPGDALVLWLRPNDLAALGNAPAHLPLVYVSGRMGGLEHAPLPADWRDVARLAYPFDLPERRRVQVDYPLGWFRMRQIPVVAEQVQADTYLVCAIVSDAINHMVDTFVRDYLVERTGEMLEHRIITGYYPRLALAPSQRFASKGGYIVRFRDRQGSSVVPESGWIVP
jgi:mono/diheme cytochrome c family protein